MNQPVSRKRKQGGFTLVEIMVVFAIISILAGIAINRYTMQKARAYYAACIIVIESTVKMQNFYYADHDEYTADISELFVYMGGEERQGFQDCYHAEAEMDTHQVKLGPDGNSWSVTVTPMGLYRDICIIEVDQAGFTPGSGCPGQPKN